MFLSVKGITKSYLNGTKKFNALDNVSFEVEKGEIAAILGPSGSGKSTLLNTIGGIDRLESGTIEVNGLDITKLKDQALTDYRRDYVGFVFQFYNLIPNLTVYENIEVAKDVSKNPLDMKKVLKAVGLEDKVNNFPSQLSGGEQQRVSIARAIVKNPELLLCDEPTGALDYETSKEILKLIQQINSEFNTTVLIITHNSALAQMANRVMKIRSGEIIENKINNEVVSAERIEW